MPERLKLVARNTLTLAFQPLCLAELSLVVKSVQEHGLPVPFPVVRKGSRYIIKGREIYFLAAEKLRLAKVPIVEIRNEREHDRQNIASLLGPSENSIDLARRIRFYQEGYKVNQSQLGREFGISQSLVSRYLRLLGRLYESTLKLYQRDLLAADSSRNHRQNPASRMGAPDIGFRHLYELTYIHHERSGLSEQRATELQSRLMNQMTNKCSSVSVLRQRIRALIKRPFSTQPREVENVPRIRTYLADSRYLLNVVPEESVQLVLTSPPYNLDKPYELSRSIAEHLENIVPPLQAAALALIPGGWYFLNIVDFKLAHGDYLPIRDILIYALRSCGLRFVSPSIWAKPKVRNQSAPNEKRQHLNYSIAQNLEYMLVFRREGERQIDPELAEQSKAMITNDEDKNEWCNFSAVMQFNTELRGDDAGEVGNAVMSRSLAEFVVRGFSLLGDTVLDPFSGTGTTLLAAQENNRCGIGFESSTSVFNQHLKLYHKAIPGPHCEPSLPSGWRSILFSVLECVGEQPLRVNTRKRLA